MPLLTVTFRRLGLNTITTSMEYPTPNTVAFRRTALRDALSTETQLMNQEFQDLLFTLKVEEQRGPLTCH